LRGVVAVASTRRLCDALSRDGGRLLLRALDDLFVGVSGAAVLTGLLFVSLSINLQPILGQLWLPRRAA
jgi:hypothetical protein